MLMKYIYIYNLIYFFFYNIINEDTHVCSGNNTHFKHTVYPANKSVARGKFADTRSIVKI